MLPNAAPGSSKNIVPNRLTARSSSLGKRTGIVPPTPCRCRHRPGPMSWSQACHTGAVVPASANGPPSGQGMRSTGAVQVAGLWRMTPRPASSAQMTSWQARSTGSGTAPRTATYPSRTKVAIPAWLSTAPGWHELAAVRNRITAAGERERHDAGQATQAGSRPASIGSADPPLAGLLAEVAAEFVADQQQWPAAQSQFRTWRELTLRSPRHSSGSTHSSCPWPGKRKTDAQ